MSWSSRRVRVIFSLVMVTVVVAAIVPALRPLLTGSQRPTDVRLSGNELYQAMAVESLTSLWFLAVGASLGSFLNVVVYRLPRRESVIWRPSYCPRCHSPIRLTDNIPLFGWVMLRGRCRDCWLPISMRYPLVELAVGWMVWALAQRELISGGASLPVRPLNRLAGATWVVWTPDWGLIAIFAYHALLLLLITAWALMVWDGRQPPRRFALFALVSGVGLAIVMPSLHPLPPLDPAFWQAMVAPATATHTFAGLGALIGMGLGGVLGALVVGLSRRRSPHVPAEPPADETPAAAPLPAAARITSVPDVERESVEGEAAEQTTASDQANQDAAADELAASRPEDEPPTTQAVETPEVPEIPLRRLEVRRLNAILAGATVGAFLGWQAVLTVALLAAVVHAASRIPWTTALWPATTLVVLFWRQLWELGWTPGARLTTANVVAALVSVVLIAAVAAAGATFGRLFRWRRVSTPRPA